MGEFDCCPWQRKVTQGDMDPVLTYEARQDDAGQHLSDSLQKPFQTCTSIGSDCNALEGTLLFLYCGDLGSPLLTAHSSLICKATVTSGIHTSIRWSRDAIVAVEPSDLRHRNLSLLPTNTHSNTCDVM